MISAILAIIIVNIMYKFFMFITGQSYMLVSLKNKIGWYIVVGFILFTLIGI